MSLRIMHIKVVAFRAQKLLPVTDVLAVRTDKPAAKASDLSLIHI